MTARDGEKDKARGIRREQDQVRLHADGNSLRKARRDRATDGSEQIRGDGEAFEEANTWEGTAALGKILSQLEELREAHLAYVNAHTDRLRARLAEDEEHRSKIITDMDALREEIILQMSKNGAASDEEG